MSPTSEDLEGAPDAERRARSVVTRWVQARLRGEALSFDTVCEEHPDIAERLGELRLEIEGGDTLLVGETLAAYHQKRRLQTAANSDGFIPGEAASAILVGPPRDGDENPFLCEGIGYGSEPAPVESEGPCRADGLVSAINDALRDAGTTLGQLDYRVTDLSGEQYGFKEAALALTRVLRERKEEFDIWHPADSIGEVGAAAVVAMLAAAKSAAQKGYAPGPGVILHAASDGAERAAMVLRLGGGRAS